MRRSRAAREGRRASLGCWSPSTGRRLPLPSTSMRTNPSMCAITKLSVQAGCHRWSQAPPIGCAMARMRTQSAMEGIGMPASRDAPTSVSMGAPRGPPPGPGHGSSCRYSCVGAGQTGPEISATVRISGPGGTSTRRRQPTASHSRLWIMAASIRVATVGVCVASSVRAASVAPRQKSKRARWWSTEIM